MGIVVAAISLVISLSPSLLPRTWWWQGLVSGILVEVGYAVGALLAWILSSIWRGAGVQISAKRNWIIGGRWALWLAAGVWAIWMVVQSVNSNRRSAILMGFNPMTGLDYLRAGGVAILVVATITGLVHMLVNLWRLVKRSVGRFMPEWGASVAAWVIVSLVVVFVTSDLLFERGMEYAYGWFAKTDRADEPGVSAPVQPERSGSPASYEYWDAIGKQGRRYLAQGPHKENIEAVTGREAMEPIRIYAGLNGDRTLDEITQVAVTEMRRTKALERSTLVITTTTGTGWVEEWSTQAVEYLTGGDVATVAIQYSSVPSAISFLREFERPAEAGVALYDAVMSEVNALPEDERPAVYLAGNSLGAYGSQAPFKNAAELLNGVDGAVWAGTPNASPLWQKLENSRHKGSPEIAPVVNSGRNIRFVTKPAELTTDIYGRDLAAWQYPRVAFVQHPTDPVVWWNFSTIRERPDWLREPAPPERNPDMQWTRFVTFVQLSADLPVAGLASDGHGHTYHREYIPVWASVLGLTNNDEEARAVGENPYDADGSWVNEAAMQRIADAISESLYG